jgi:hypothetical protein
MRNLLAAIVVFILTPLSLCAATAVWEGEQVRVKTQWCTLFPVVSFGTSVRIDGRDILVVETLQAAHPGITGDLFCYTLSLLLPLQPGTYRLIWRGQIEEIIVPPTVPVLGHRELLVLAAALVAIALRAVRA